MKKTLVAAILGLVATATVMAQGRIRLDSYAGSYPTITYGSGSGGPLNGLVGAGSGFTVGLYYQLASGASFVDGTGVGVPGSPWLLATGSGSTAPMIGAGIYQTALDWSVTGFVDPSPLPVPAISVVIVAYNGSSYATSLIRGHSQAFNITPAVGAAFATQTGLGMNSFQVIAVPEPSTFALAGLGLASLLIFRRRK